MGAMVSQIISITIVYSTIYSLVTGEFPTQMASNMENISIWWRHHVSYWAVVMARPCSGLNRFVQNLCHCFTRGQSVSPPRQSDICASGNWVIIGPCNCLSPVRHQAITRTTTVNMNLRTNFKLRLNKNMKVFILKKCIWKCCDD